MKKLIIPIILLAGAYFFIPKFKEIVDGLFSKVKQPINTPNPLPSSTVSTVANNNQANNQN